MIRNEDLENSGAVLHWRRSLHDLGIHLAWAQPWQNDPAGRRLLLTGLMVNRDYSVWDYRQMPLQYLGQVCLPYSLLWIPVCLLGMNLYGLAEKLLRRAGPAID